MAGTKPASKIARLADRHATQMCANAQHDEPFGLLDAVGVGLWVAQGFDFDGFGFFDFGVGAVADEDGFAAPFDDYLSRRERGNGLVGRVLKGKNGEDWD
jgi:hypothetical protein